MHPDRLDELHFLLEEGDLNRLSRRMVDFLIDYEVPASARRSIIAFRARYNLELAQQTGDVEEVKQSLLNEAVALLADLEGAPATQSATPDDQVVTIAQGLTKTFRQAGFTFTLPPVDLSLTRGTITGVVGENGNGKTTLLRMLAGELASDGGELAYPAFNVGLDWVKIKRKIAFIPQNLEPWPGKLKQQLQYTAALHGILGDENEDQVTLMIHRLGLSRYLNAGWKEISSGYRLRFELARALLRSPDLLVIDEPLANLDLNTQQVFMQDLRYLASGSYNPPALVLTSQHLSEVESISDHLVFIRNGQLLFNGPMVDFASDRGHNLYELTTDLPRAALMAITGFPANWEVREVHKLLLVQTPLETSSTDVLQVLVAAGVRVHYFRDISTSTVKLFREED